MLNSLIPPVQTPGVQQRQVWSPPQLQAILYTWVAFPNSEHPKVLPRHAASKMLPKAHTESSPFLFQLIKPFSQRLAQGTEERASASPVQRSSALLPEQSKLQQPIRPRNPLLLWVRQLALPLSEYRKEQEVELDPEKGLGTLSRTPQP